MNITDEIKNEIITLLNKEKLFGFEYIDNFDFNEKRVLNNQLPDTIETLNEHISNCSLCELSKTKSLSSFSRGNTESEIVLVSLSSEYDLSDKYFLDMKAVLNIDINDIYMTNILKCGSNKYKNNLDDEISKCIGYLEQQISILKPKFIITLGAAFNYMINNNEDVLNISANVYKYKGITLFPLLDVDFINKNPSYKNKMFTDLKKIKITMDKI